MKKLRNVIKGHQAHEVIDSINIIDAEEMVVAFCGSFDSFMNPPDFMERFRDELMDRNVTKSLVNGTRLDVFIGTAGNKNAAPSAKEEPKAIMENPVIYMIHHGPEALKAKLEELSLEELQTVIRTYHITTTRSKDPEKLRSLIWNRSEVRATQGATFKDFDK